MQRACLMYFLNQMEQLMAAAISWCRATEAIASMAWCSFSLRHNGNQQLLLAGACLGGPKHGDGAFQP